jgi:hypothetical protein
MDATARPRRRRKAGRTIAEKGRYAVRLSRATIRSRELRYRAIAER